MKVALYRHYSEDKTLLYVGISNRIPRRIKEHKKLSKWFEEVVDIKIEWFSERGTAAIAEKKAIKTEKPKWNIVHNKQDEIIEEIEESILDELVNKNSKFYNKLWNGYKKATMLLSLSRVAECSGIPTSKIKLLVSVGRIKSVLEKERHREGNNKIYYTYVVSLWSLLAFMEEMEEHKRGLAGIIEECEKKPVRFPLTEDLETAGTAGSTK